MSGLTGHIADIETPLSSKAKTAASSQRAIAIAREVQRLKGFSDERIINIACRLTRADMGTPRYEALRQICGMQERRGCLQSILSSEKGNSTFKTKIYEIVRDNAQRDTKYRQILFALVDSRDATICSWALGDLAFRFPRDRDVSAKICSLSAQIFQTLGSGTNQVSPYSVVNALGCLRTGESQSLLREYVQRNWPKDFQHLGALFFDAYIKRIGGSPVLCAQVANLVPEQTIIKLPEVIHDKARLKLLGNLILEHRKNIKPEIAATLEAACTRSDAASKDIERFKGNLARITETTKSTAEELYNLLKRSATTFNRPVEEFAKMLPTDLKMKVAAYSIEAGDTQLIPFVRQCLEDPRHKGMMLLHLGFMNKNNFMHHPPKGRAFVELVQSALKSVSSPSEFQTAYLLAIGCSQFDAGMRQIVGKAILSDQWGIRELVGFACDANGNYAKTVVQSMAADRSITHPEHKRAIQEYQKLVNAGFRFPFRFSGETAALVNADRAPGASSKHTITMVLPKRDWNGAFFVAEEHIRTLRQAGYRVLVFEAGSDRDAIAAMTKSAQISHRPASAVFLCAHGFNAGMSFGEDDPRLRTAKGAQGVGKGAGTLGNEDLPKLVSPQIFSSVEKKGIIILSSCSTAEVKNNLPGFAHNFSKRVPSDIKIFASDSPSGVRSINFNPLGSVTGVTFGMTEYCLKMFTGPTVVLQGSARR